jgi:hypothetical protein
MGYKTPTREGFTVALAVVGGVAVLVLAVVIAFFIGRGCTPPSPLPIVTDIDAGPGERAIADRLDAATQHARAELARIEREHAAEIAAFDAAQRLKYEAAREGGPEAADAFIRDFNRRLRDAGRR